MSSIHHLSVIGAGSWGTALAIHAAKAIKKVSLWGHNIEKMQRMNIARENQVYLPNISFPDNLQALSDFDMSLNEADAILIALPSSVFREILVRLKDLYRNKNKTLPPIIYATKGLEHHSGLFLHQIVEEVLGDVKNAILSGPSFAKEVAQGLPTAVTIAAQKIETAKWFLPIFHHHAFRIYTNDDVLGVELGGAYKNVIAIGAGISDGLGFGANARAALITRGLTEMQRLGVQLGANAHTFMGLAGLGDLILTSTDNQSRNRRFGLAVGQGIALKEAEIQIGQVVEGVNAAREILRVAAKKDIELPIIEQIAKILYEDVAPKIAVENLLKRGAKEES